MNRKLCVGVVLFFVSIFCSTVYSVESNNIFNDEHIHIPQQYIESEDSNIELESEIITVDDENIMPINFQYIGEFDCAANCCERYNHICGGTGITANGMPQTAGITAGANFDILPAGTWIYIEDVGIRQVQDTGPGCPENHIDIAVETHEEALQWGGWGQHRVWIIEEKENEN